MSFGCRKVAMRHHVTHKGSAPNSSVYQNPNIVSLKTTQNGTRKLSSSKNALLSRSNARPKEKVGVGQLAPVDERRSLVPVEARGLLDKQNNVYCSGDLPSPSLSQSTGPLGRPTVELRTATGSSDDVVDRIPSPPPRKESSV